VIGVLTASKNLVKNRGIISAQKGGRKDGPQGKMGGEISGPTTGFEGAGKPPIPILSSPNFQTQGALKRAKPPFIEKLF